MTNEKSEAADRLCRQQFGDGVFIRGIIEFSNVCACDCFYCGIRAGCRNVHRYVMSESEIVEAAVGGYRCGIRSFVLQSGEASVFSPDAFCRLLETIRRQTDPDIALTLSIGERSRSDFQRFFDAGADRFLMRFESANSAVYAKNHPGRTLSTRFEALATLKEIGYETGTGFLVGIPFEEPEDFELNLKTLIDFKPHMVGLGPFIPAPGTPAADFPTASFEKVLEAYSRIRLALPKVNLAAATALDSLRENGRFAALRAGANVYMPNLTPSSFRQHYNLYLRKTSHDRFSLLKKEIDESFAAFGKKALWNEVGSSPMLAEERRG